MNTHSFPDFLQLLNELEQTKDKLHARAQS